MGAPRPTGFVAAVVGVILVVGGFEVLISGAERTKSASGGPGPASASTTDAIVQTTTGTGLSSAAQIPAYVGCTAGANDQGKIISAILNTSQAGVLKGAYFSSWSYNQGNQCYSTSSVTVVLNVTGTQEVSGNWSSHYTIVYSNNKLVGFKIALPAYQVANITVTDLPDRVQTTSFSAQNLQAIGVALSNSTVKQHMGGEAYCAVAVPSSGLRTGRLGTTFTSS